MNMLLITNQDVTDRCFLGPLRPWFSMDRHVLPPESSDGCLGRWSPHRVQGRASMGGVRSSGGCMEAAPVYIGIDVSKAQLDLAERPSGERAVMPHTEESVTTLVERLRHRQPACLVLEASGGLEVP